MWMYLRGGGGGEGGGRGGQVDVINEGGRGDTWVW